MTRPRVHARDHEHGGADPQRIHYEDVGDSGDGGAAALIIADEGTALPDEPTLNFTGDGVTATDNPGANRIDVTIPGAEGGTGILMDTSNTGSFLDIKADDYIELVSPVSSSPSTASTLAVWGNGGAGPTGVTIQSNWGGSVADIPDGTTGGVWIFASTLHIWGIPTSAPSETGRVWRDSSGFLRLT